MNQPGPCYHHEERRKGRINRAANGAAEHTSHQDNVVWPETLSRTPWLINKSAGGPPFNCIDRCRDLEARDPCRLGPGSRGRAGPGRAGEQPLQLAVTVSPTHTQCAASRASEAEPERHPSPPSACCNRRGRGDPAPCPIWGPGGTASSHVLSRLLCRSGSAGAVGPGRVSDLTQRAGRPRPRAIRHG